MDYNIYIHDKTGGQSKPTQPKQKGSNNNTSAFGFQMAKKSSGGASTTTSNGFTVNLKNFTKIAKWGKVGIAIAAVQKVLQITAKIATKIESVGEFFAVETGDYRLATWSGNAANIIGKVASPVSAFIGDIRNRQYNYVMNRKLDQQRILNGDIYLNDISGRKM